MKKIIAIGLAAALSLTVFAGCGENKENTAPTISGVPESATVMVGEEWNALQGVTATDKEDGDLTSKIEISARGLTFEGGKTTPTEPNESRGYQVSYTVKDSGGLEAEEQFCVLYVKQAAAALVNVYEADFSDVTPKYDWAEGNEGEGNNHYWNLNKKEGTKATATLKEGRLEVDVTDRNGAGDGDLMLTRSFGDLPVGRYKFAVWARSSDNVQINLIAELSENSLKEEFRGKGDETWKKRNLGGGKYNNPETNDMKLGAEYKVYTLDFEITEDILQGDKAEVLFRVGLGGDYNPNAFKADFEKITIWKTTGSNTETDLFTLDPPTNTGGLAIANTWDNSAATLAYDTAEGAVKLDITKYNTEGGVWSIVVKAPLEGATIEAGKKYGVEVEMKATTEITPEIVVGRSENGKDEAPRYVKNDTAVGSTYTKVKGELNEFTTDTPYIFFQLGKNVGNNAPNADTNVIYIKGIRLFEIADQTETDLFTMHAGVESEAPTVGITNQGDGAANVTATVENGGATIEIGTYNTEPTGGIWSIVASIPFTGKKIDKDKTYGYAIEVKATAACKAEIACGSASNHDSDGNDKLYSQDIGTEYKVIYHTFKAGTAFSESGLHLLLGKTDGLPSVTSNTISIKSFRFFEVQGNEETSKIQDKFILFGDASPDKTNPKYPISVYNQSDDVFDAAPMGTAYFENNKLVYLIHQGGTDQGHNKLAFGYWDNPITGLPANAYYVVSFKIKASVELDFSLTLHDMDMGWDEATGAIPIRYADFGGHELLHAGTTETTIEVMSPNVSLMAHNKCELLLEFGKFLGTNKEVRIEISDLKIGYRAVQA